MQKTDILIIGAGLLGCFAARALAAYECSVTVLEAREDVCTGVSRANTGIVYAGYDTKPGTLKTELCVRANAGFAALCRELDVPFSRCGSLMVALGERGERVLQKKYADGCTNGVEGLRLLSASEVRAMEPALTERITQGLYAPGTGSVNPWELGIAAFENAAENGVEFRFSEAVERITRTDGGFVVESEKDCYFARTVLNCAGLRADAVRELCEAPLVRIFPSAADYLVLDTTVGGHVRRIISHEPEEKGKGLTLVPTVDGNLLVGPTERDALSLDGAPTDAEGLDLLRRLCSEIVPDLDLSQAIRNFGALRPNPYYVNCQNGKYIPENRGISSFTVLEEEGLLSLIGIKTPGLTCAAELGHYAADKLLARLGGAARKAGFDPTRRGIPRPAEMPEAQRAAFIAEHGEYGRILCRCRNISEGEVREAIHRGAVTVDGVKRRVGTGMGRCQGGRCMQHIMELLAAQRDGAVSEITKNGDGEEIVYGTL